MKTNKSKYRKAIFVVVYSIVNRKIYYLVLKRKWHWIGWEFPKGGIEKSENILNSVKREVFEETGQKALKIKRFSVSGKYSYKRKLEDRPGYKGQSYDLFSVQIKKGKIQVDEKEHSTYRWVAFEKAYKILTWSNQKRCLSIVDKWLKNLNMAKFYKQNDE